MHPGSQALCLPPSCPNPDMPWACSHHPYLLLFFPKGLILHSKSRIKLQATAWYLVHHLALPQGHPAPCQPLSLWSHLLVATPGNTPDPDAQSSHAHATHHSQTQCFGCSCLCPPDSLPHSHSTTHTPAWFFRHPPTHTCFPEWRGVGKIKSHI